MLDSFHAHLLYRALKLHFSTEKYDFFTFHGKLNKANTLAARNKFLNSDLKYYFETLGKHSDPGNLLVSNFLINPKLFITDIVSDTGLNNYKKRVARLSSLYYNFEQELEHISGIKEMKSVDSTGMPFIINKLVAGDISPETIVLIDRVINKLDDWQELDHPLVEKHILKLRKYRKFVPIRMNKIQIIFEKLYS